MVKTAYQKLCFYPLARVAVFGLLLSALLYQFHGLLSGGDELVARVLGWICLGFGALHRVFACGGRNSLCHPGPAGEPPSAQSSRLCTGALGARTCKPGTGSMTCILPATSSWSIGSSSGASRALPVSPTRRSVASASVKMAGQKNSWTF